MRDFQDRAVKMFLRVCRCNDSLLYSSSEGHGHGLHRPASAVPRFVPLLSDVAHSDRARMGAITVSHPTSVKPITPLCVSPTSIPGHLRLPPVWHVAPHLALALHRFLLHRLPSLQLSWLCGRACQHVDHLPEPQASSIAVVCVVARCVWRCEYVARGMSRRMGVMMPAHALRR